MTQDEMRRLFDIVLTEPDRDTTDLDAAMRDGRRRRRLHSGLVVLSASAAAAVVVALGMWLSGALTTSTPVAAGVPTTASASDTTRPSTSPSPTAGAGLPQVGAPVTEVSQLLGYWRATELEGRDVHDIRTRAGAPLVVQFSGPGPGNKDAWWNADDGCNDHGGTVTVADGAVFAEGDTRSLVGCSPRAPYQENVQAVKDARRARVAPGAGASPTRLLLLDADGRVVGRYDAVPNADRSRPYGVALTSSSNLPGTRPSAPMTGRLTIDAGGCAGLDRHTTVFPAGTTWAPALGLLVLHDGRTVAPGQTITGTGTSVPPSVAKGLVADPNLQTTCPWTPEVRVLSGATTG